MTWRRTTTTTGWLRFVANLSSWTKLAVGADHVRLSLAALSSLSLEWILSFKWRVGLAFFPCIDLLGVDRTVVHGVEATRHNTPSLIWAMFSLVSWPDETIGHVYLAVAAARKGLPGARVPKGRPRPDRHTRWHQATRRPVITR
jgi:hypothetical protein